MCKNSKASDNTGLSPSYNTGLSLSKSYISTAITDNVMEMTIITGKNRYPSSYDFYSTS